MARLTQPSKDEVFNRIDLTISYLEDEGYPLDFILDVIRDYVELCDELLLH